MAGLFDADGRPRASFKQSIAIWFETGDIVKRSSADIWAAVCVSVPTAVQDGRFDPVDIGLDATALEVTMRAKPVTPRRHLNLVNNINGLKWRTRQDSKLRPLPLYGCTQQDRVSIRANVRFRPNPVPATRSEMARLARAVFVLGAANRRALFEHSADGQRAWDSQQRNEAGHAQNSLVVLVKAN